MYIILKIISIKFTSYEYIMLTSTTLSHVYMFLSSLYILLIGMNDSKSSSKLFCGDDACSSHNLI